MSKVYALSKLVKPVGDGVSKAYHVELLAVAKHSHISSSMVASEYVAAKLGSYLGLPIPPFALVVPKGTNPAIWFASLNFNLTGYSLPQIDPEQCVAAFPDLSTGVVIFDAWIANPDRHEENLNIDWSGSKPRLNVFDHGYSILGQEGTERLSRLLNHVGITSDTH